jgi:hypothetical protein
VLGGNLAAHLSCFEYQRINVVVEYLASLRLGQGEIAAGGRLYSIGSLAKAGEAWYSAAFDTLTMFSQPLKPEFMQQAAEGCTCAVQQQQCCCQVLPLWHCTMWQLRAALLHAQ